MGHIQQMTDKQRSEFIAYSYNRRKEENKGNSFEWYNEDNFLKYQENGYQMFEFKNTFEKDATTSVLIAKETVEKLRSEGNYARIICGYIQTRQRVRHFTVIYKSKTSRQSNNT